MSGAAKRIFTDRSLKALGAAAPGKRLMVWDGLLPGFGMRITSNNVKSFVVLARLAGKRTPVRIVLGRYPALTLADAREKARKVLADMSTGIDPRLERKRIALEETALKEG